MVKRAPFLTGLFLLCMSTLMLQIIETRILSVVSMYYLAFLSISMAMLGMSVGALMVYFKLDRVRGAGIAPYLARVSTGFALAILVCFLLLLASPLVLVKSGTLVLVWLKAIVLLAAPFAVAGVAVSLALTRSPFPVGITYGVDLLGAAFGCLLVILLMDLIDASSAVFAVAALAAAAGVCFRMADTGNAGETSFPNWGILRRPGAVAAALAALAAVNASTRAGFQPISAKFDVIEADSAFEFVEWNSISRISVGQAQMRRPYLWGPSPEMPDNVTTEQRGLNIDGFAGTAMSRFGGDPADADFLRYDISNLAYAARTSGRAAVIGVGGGRDVLSAHLFGFRDVTGVELNPIFIDMLTDPGRLRGFAGVADLPGVRFVVDEGRSWFARTEQRFDLIQMSMIDTWAATGAGAFSLSENGLYTVEGWRIFLSALTPGGLFTVSRWHSPTAPVEVGRATSLAVGALLAMGVQNPRAHVFLASIGNLATLIVSRQPFTAADLQTLHDAAERLRFEVLASPDRGATEAVFNDLLSATSAQDLDARAGRYLLDLSPPTDARPFFFNQLRIFSPENFRAMLDEYRRTGQFFFGSSFVAVGNLVAMSTLLLLIALSLLAVVVTVLWPARSSVHRVKRRFALLGSAYFLLIGLGFMFIEIGLIQRISVFLGHPVYALGIVLFSIILSTGIGSLLWERFAPSGAAGLLLWLSALVIYLFSLPHWLSLLTHSSLESAGLFARAAVSVAVILPAGVLMGFGFPTGMRLVAAHDSRPTPWFWGVNSAAGVLAAGLAVVCSIGFSIHATVRVGAFCYLLLAPVAVLLLKGPHVLRSRRAVA